MKVKKVPTLEEVKKMTEHYNKYKHRINYVKDNIDKINHISEVTRKLINGEEITDEDMDKLNKG